MANVNSSINSINGPSNLSSAMLPIWQSPFRSLFLLGALFSSAVLITWSLQLTGALQLNTYGNGLYWHAHEMLFGFTLAIVVGFLLTAVKNWTGNPSAQGPAIKLMIFLWCLSRLLWLFSGSPAWLMAIVDSAFPFYSAYWLAKPLLNSGQKHNWPFVGVLIALGLLQILYHALLNFKPELISQLHSVVVLVMANLVFWVGGRILPFFVQAKLQIPRRVLPNWLTPMAMLSSWSLIPLSLMGSPKILTVVAFSAGILHSVRLAMFWRNKAIKESMLWSLFIASGWIVLGIIALGLQRSEWLHLITVGGLGGMILSVISRVSLGHIGEPIRALSWMPMAFIFISLAGLIRFFAQDIQILGISGYTLSAALWALAFGGFLYHYTRRLLSARKDGKAG
jgi:uncharacterized protein involved in response to NO